MQRRNLTKNPNAGKRHGKPWDARRSTNYAHSNLLRMGFRNYKHVTVKVDTSLIREREPVSYTAK
jgi:hypothetical protein